MRARAAPRGRWVERAAARWRRYTGAPMAKGARQTLFVTAPTDKAPGAKPGDLLTGVLKVGGEDKCAVSVVVPKEEESEEDKKDKADDGKTDKEREAEEVRDARVKFLKKLCEDKKLPAFDALATELAAAHPDHLPLLRSAPAQAQRRSARSQRPPAPAQHASMSALTQHAGAARRVRAAVLMPPGPGGREVLARHDVDGEAGEAEPDRRERCVKALKAAAAVVSAVDAGALAAHFGLKHDTAGDAALKAKCKEMDERKAALIDALLARWALHPRGRAARPRPPLTRAAQGGARRGAAGAGAVRGRAAGSVARGRDGRGAERARRAAGGVGAAAAVVAQGPVSRAAAALCPPALRRVPPRRVRAGSRRRAALGHGARFRLRLRVCALRAQAGGRGGSRDAEAAQDQGGRCEEEDGGGMDRRERAAGLGALGGALQGVRALQAVPRQAPALLSAPRAAQQPEPLAAGALGGRTLSCFLVRACGWCGPAPAVAGVCEARLRGALLAVPGPADTTLLYKQTPQTQFCFTNSARPNRFSPCRSAR